jgi:glutamate-1-semialdehyde 2,1-aminomutase
MVRVARAYTKRERVAVCGYHGWQDWYIGTTSRKDGVPVCVQELTQSFEFNNLDSLEQLLLAHPGEFGLVMLEALGFTYPDPGFLEGVRDLAHAHGALFGFDEVISGFRAHAGGAQALLGVTPDIAAFGKGMANGLPLSCVAGRRDIMEVFDRIFFSSTFGGEVVALAAANRFLDIITDGIVLNKVAEHGERLKERLSTLVSDTDLNELMKCVGHGSHWGLVLNPKSPEEGMLWRSYLIQECTKRGYIFFGSHNPTRSHDDAAMDFAMSVYSEVLPLFAERLKLNDMQQHMEGKIIDPIFRIHK